MSQHHVLTGPDVHVLHAWTYADATARDAVTYVATDVGRAARVLSPESWFVLVSTTPTWLQITTPAFLVGVGPPASTLGNTSDSYFDRASGNFYYKS